MQAYNWFTFPVFPATKLFCIFMASRTHISWPSITCEKNAIWHWNEPNCDFLEPSAPALICRILTSQGDQPYGVCDHVPTCLLYIAYSSKVSLCECCQLAPAPFTCCDDLKTVNSLMKAHGAEAMGSLDRGHSQLPAAIYSMKIRRYMAEI